MLIKILQQIKWQDVLYISLFNILMKLNLLSALQLQSNLPNFYFFLLAFSLILILIGGNLAKVFFDEEETTIPKKILFLLYIFLFAVANGINFYVSISLRYSTQFTFIVFFTLFVFFYSERSLKKSFLNNIIEAFLTTFAIILVWWFDPVLNSENHWKKIEQFELVVILFVSLTFIANLVKNILQDFTSITTDKSKNFKTLPVVLNEKESKKFILYATIIVMIALSIISFFYVESFLFGFVLLTLTGIPTFFLYNKLIKAKSKEDYKKLIKIYYVVIFAGMAVIPIASLIFKNIA